MSHNTSSSDLQREWNILKARRNANVEDKFEVLDARDRIQRSRLKSQQKGLDEEDDAEVVIKGRGLEMCPEKERYQRLKEKRVDTWEENGQLIKDFSRQAADQDMPLPSELRTEGTLRSTMDYLLREIISRPPENPENPAGWYDFVWRRLRAIRKEITQQRLTGAVVASILEDMCRFHLVSCHMFCQADHSQFDHKFNLEAVNDCLASLTRIYADMEVEKVYSANAAEMRSYEMLLRIWSDKVDLVKITSLVLQLPAELQAQPEVAFARKVVSACNSRLYCEYIALLRQADYVTACLMHYYLPMVQARALHHLAISSGPRSKGAISLPLDFVQSTFGLNTAKELDIFCTYHGLEWRAGEALVTFNAASSARRDPKTFPRVRSLEYVESKVGGRNMAETIARKKFSDIPAPTTIQVYSFDENDVYSGEDPWTSVISNMVKIPPPQTTKQPTIGFFQHLLQAQKVAADLPSQVATSTFTFKSPSSSPVSSSWQPSSPHKIGPPTGPASLSRFSLKRTLSSADAGEEEAVLFLGSKRPQGPSSPPLALSPPPLASLPVETSRHETATPPTPAKVPPHLTEEKADQQVHKDYPLPTHLKLIRGRAVCHGGGILHAVFKAWRTYAHSIRQPTFHFGPIDAPVQQVQRAQALAKKEANQWLWSKWPIRSFLRERPDFDVGLLLYLYIDRQAAPSHRMATWLRTKLGDPRPEEQQPAVRLLTFSEGPQELSILFLDVCQDVQAAHTAVGHVRDHVGALCMYCATKADLAVAQSFRHDLHDGTDQTLPAALFCPGQEVAEEEVDGLPGNLLLQVALTSSQPSLQLSVALWDSIKLLLVRRIPARIPHSVTLLHLLSQLYCDFLKMSRALQAEMREELSSKQLRHVWNALVDTYLQERDFLLDKGRMCDWLVQKLPDNELATFLKVSDDDETWSYSPVDIFPIGLTFELTCASQETRGLLAIVAQKLSIVTAAASLYDPVSRSPSSSRPLPDFDLMLKKYLEELDTTCSSTSSAASSGQEDDDVDGGAKKLSRFERPSNDTASSADKDRESLSYAFQSVRQTRNHLSEWFTGLSTLLNDLDSL
ncbi:hypothetical protein RvY_13841 [Ramazzottius varieornatus]|uniref:SAC3/GANP/THP3 conserved domain-containing protein n=1 Tax=Ramazzottius varieornatus TaxID=947166 RepID=A0A1D1VWP3_RAMVA|nr:hypothetical protein RvY_13841 [Ramazzottius varieornatus]